MREEVNDAMLSGSADFTTRLPLPLPQTGRAVMSLSQVASGCESIRVYKTNRCLPLWKVFPFKNKLSGPCSTGVSWGDLAVVSQVKAAAVVWLVT